MVPLDDTIVAVASPPGGAARGIVRLSGPDAFRCLDALGRLWAEGPAVLPAQGNALGTGTTTDSIGPTGQPFAEPTVNGWSVGPVEQHSSQPNTPGRCPGLAEQPPLRGEQPSAPRVVAASLKLPELFSPLPCDVYCWPRRGYTGQPCIEIHTLGSPPLLQIVVHALCVAGARVANRGEFTLRAFLAGRIDLTQAEAVLGVIDADNSAALAVALDQLAGGLARPLHRLRDALVDLLAHVEAGFDFADEDLPFITREELCRQLIETESGVAALLRQMVSRTESSDSVRAVLIGRPNAGKSSLFNAIVGHSAAIVSHQPGTTRDYLTADLELDGVKLRLIDTAGIGSPCATLNTESTVDRAARSAAETQHRTADLRVLCLDSTRPMDDWERRTLQEETDERSFVVLTKCDQRRATDCTANAVETSSMSGQGIETLRDELQQKVLAAAGASDNVVAGTASRCRESLRLAGESLRRAVVVAADGQEELAAAEIRVALDELGRVTGAVYTDDVLDRIFSRFCVGK